MIIRHALLDLVTIPTNKQSSIIINNEIIITSATILDQYLKELPLKNLQTIIETLTESKRLIKVQEDNQFDFLKTLKFEIIFDEKSNFAVNSPRILTRYRADLQYLYSCESVKKCFQTILQKISPVDNISEILVSSFIVLFVIRPNIEKLSPNIYYFIQSVIEYNKSLKPINKLDDVITICTPFGLEMLYKTVNIGKVSNVLGENSCLFVISNTLPQGCEGSAVLNSKLRLIGILICTSLHGHNENFSLSLVGNFYHIIKEFINQCGTQFDSTYLTMIRAPVKWENSLVIIKNSNSQGTGTFVKIFNKKFILTCSHVLSNDNSITCRYIDGCFKPEIIWKNPNFNEPFDIALLSVPSNITDNYFVDLSNTKPHLGQSIYNCGFPFFTNIDTNQTSAFTPSIFEGRIIKYSPGILISDGILQAGQSGGPMFDEKGSVVAICVSNLKLDHKIYPNINTSVPICDIKNILERFVKFNDNSILNELIAVAAVKKKWALETPFIESKL